MTMLTDANHISHTERNIGSEASQTACLHVSLSITKDFESIYDFIQYVRHYAASFSVLLGQSQTASSRSAHMYKKHIFGWLSV
jgi:hypothetical protein